MDKYIGKKIDGRYEIRELVGVGGMANVYKAYDAIDERIVAVKILRDEYVQNEEFLRRFKNESKAISVLSHPNIVRVYDVSFSPKGNSIVMEFIDGITLKDYIDQQGVIQYKEAVYFSVQILRALQHAHDKGIVHRDIKPHNIMLLSDGTIKITDFGIARFARSETKTLTDKAIGSVHYISPEQASGGTTDERTDLYSVGVMLFEMLTGKVPFEADSPVSVAIKQIQSQPLLPRSINPDIPEGLEEIVIRAMQKDVTKRYQSSAEMLQDIDEFKRNPTISFEYKYLNTPIAGKNPKERTSMQARGEKMNKRKSKKTSRSKSEEAGLPVLPVLAGIAFAFALVSALFIGLLFIVNKPFAVAEDIIAPTLVGQNYEDVIRNKDYKDQIKIELEEMVFSAEYPDGVIFRQEPSEGKTIKQGTTVRVKVSAGAQMVILPNYTGQDSSEVYKQLKDLGLKHDEFQIFSDTVPEGVVVRTDPDSQTEIQTGEMVTVYVSRGPQERITRVPNLAGMHIDEAKRLLVNYRLRIGNVSEGEVSQTDEVTGADGTSTAPAVGTVLAQSPAPDTQVPEGSAIDVKVVKGYLAPEESEPEEEEKEDSITITVELPKDGRFEVKLEAFMGNKRLYNIRVVPNKDKSVELTFSGEGRMYVDILLDSEDYARYRLDFDSLSYKQIK